MPPENLFFYARITEAFYGFLKIRTSYFIVFFDFQIALRKSEGLSHSLAGGFQRKLTYKFTENFEKTARKRFLML